MKGLILKDLYIIRFQIIAGMLLMLLPNVAMMMIFGASNTDAGDPAADPLTAMIFGMMNFVNICLFSSFVLNTLKDDIDSGWAKIERTFPVRGSKIVGAKLISSGLVVLLLTLFSLFFNVLAGVIHDLNIELMITIPVCIGIFQMMVLAPLFPLALRIGVKFTEALYLTVEIVVIVFAVLLLNKMLETGVNAVLLRIIFYGGLPLLAAASCVISYLCGKRRIKSR